MNYITHFRLTAAHALVASTVILSLLCMGFFLTEPTIGHGAESTTIEIQATISDETSFLVDPTSVDMTGQPINGVTGGVATGTTQFTVLSNNVAGYNVTIDFYDNSTNGAMLGDVTASEAIRNFGTATMTPIFGYTASTAAEFMYTVTSSTTADTDSNFWNNGSICGVGADKTADLCWMTPSTSPYTIIDRGTSAPTGATSTVKFRVVVPAGATPVPTAETYTATTTLTVTSN